MDCFMTRTKEDEDVEVDVDVDVEEEEEERTKRGEERRYREHDERGRWKPGMYIGYCVVCI